MLNNDTDQLNDDIEQWNKRNLQALRDKISSLNIKHRDNSPNKLPLARALRSQLRKKDGIISRISYKMPVSAIFLHKGVSRGHPVTNPRRAKEWYAPVVDKTIDELADIVADGQGNMVINNINIK